jgi:cytoskeletal protein CcmA (bactofilin family)
MKQDTLSETSINLVSEDTRIEGQVQFDHVTRVHGTLVGKVTAKVGSTLILSETALTEGSIDADVLFVDGFVQGDISAKTRVIISKTGRVVGNITTPSLVIESGAYFEGQCIMEAAAIP